MLGQVVGRDACQPRGMPAHFFFGRMPKPFAAAQMMTIMIVLKWMGMLIKSGALRVTLHVACLPAPGATLRLLCVLACVEPAEVENRSSSPLQLSGRTLGPSSCSDSRMQPSGYRLLLLVSRNRCARVLLADQPTKVHQLWAVDFSALEAKAPTACLSLGDVN